MPFDNPVFKVLAHNDTGGAVGHQGGILIPKDLEDYFPTLAKAQANPTVSALIQAELFNGSSALATVMTRYQYQTWGKTRSPERRVTGNLGELRSRAAQDDILLIERDLSHNGHYRFTLLKKGTSQHVSIVKSRAGLRWGYL